MKEYNSERRYRLVREVVETIAFTILIFLVTNLTIQNYDIHGPSMEPSLHNLERIMVDKVSYLFHAPARGDVVVFIAPPQPSVDYVKRIIGLPGDIITIRHTTVIVDGVTLQETYVDPQQQGNPFPSFVNRIVPPNEYFVMGDNRMNSSDSRDWGFLPRQNIIGRAALVYWPLGQDNTGFLPDVSAVFAHIHQKANTTPARPIGAVDQMLLGVMPSLFIFRSWRRSRSRKLWIFQNSP